MEEASLTILGSSSATPTIQRFSTAQLLQLRGRTFLIDCGEGTQIQLRRYHFSMHRIDAIFISHLHGDHFFGLPGMLSSMHLLNRVKPLTVYAPEGAEALVRGLLKIQGTWLSYPLEFQTIRLDAPQVIYSDGSVEVSAFPLQHRIECHGFFFRELPRRPNLLKDAVTRYQIPVYMRSRIKDGEGFTTPTGEFIPHEKLTAPPPPTVSYAFFSDTTPVPALANWVRHATLLYHEATFIHEDRVVAEKTGHSTALDAAQFARSAEVELLVIGHISPRYPDFKTVLHEAQTQFSRTELAEDGATYQLRSLELSPPRE